MKNCVQRSIDIDIISCVVFDEAKIGITSEVRYILEINAGEAARRGIRVGDRLRLE